VKPVFIKPTREDLADSANRLSVGLYTKPGVPMTLLCTSGTNGRISNPGASVAYVKA